MRIVLLVAPVSGGVDGIGDYSLRLAQAVGEAGDHATVMTWADGTWSRTEPDVGRSREISWRELVAISRQHQALILQYSPFSWGRRGFAQGLLTQLLMLRRQPGRPLLAAMLHEKFVPWGSWRQSLMSGWQRAQLVAVRRLVDLQFVSTEPWLSLARAAQGREFLLPVGSNVPDGRSQRDAARAALNLRAGELVCATFGSNHPSYLTDHAADVVNRIASTTPVTLLSLGATARLPAGLSDSVRAVEFGMLSPSEISAALSAADLFVAPLTDGISTRRTTVMAALQHGLPIVGTRGASTGSLFEDTPACRLAPASRAADLAEQAAGLCDGDARSVSSRAARLLYEQHFDWPTIANSMMTALGSARERRNECN